MHSDQILLHDKASIDRMQHVPRLARQVLDYTCSLATPGVETDDIDTAVHEAIIEQGNVYPSPLNYVGFPKPLCSSINESTTEYRIHDPCKVVILFPLM
jgi:methionyl aminopeptidase